MRSAIKLLAMGALLCAGSACHKRSPAPQQNSAIDEDLMNGGSAKGTPDNADIETLPPDESSTTPSNQLQNGSDNPDVNEANASANFD